MREAPEGGARDVRDHRRGDPTGRAIRVVSGENEVGVVTSGTLSPCLEVGIGMGYVRAGIAEPGTAIEIDVRGKRRPAEIRERPLYSKDK